jgi:hypothetical protein
MRTNTKAIATTKPTTTNTPAQGMPVLPSGASVATPAVAALPAMPATIAAIGGYATGTTNAIAPAGGSVFAAVLACGPCTVAQAQAAINAVGRKGTHPLLPLLRWQARNRGWAFAFVGGLLHCYPTLAAYQAAGY